MKRVFAAAFVGLLGIGAGSAASGPAGPGDAPARPDGTLQCLDSDAIVSRTAEDGQTLRFEALGGRVYRNRLSGRCPGLSQAAHGFGTLAFEQHGSRLCRGDLLRVVDPSRGGTMTLATAPACPLGDFEPVAEPPARRR